MEAAELGPLLRRTTAVVTQLVDPDQVYVTLWSPLWLAERLADVPGVVPAPGAGASGSDWDFALYYAEGLDPADIRALGFPGTVFAPGDWAYPMNGGAWLTVNGQKVDLLYRDLEDVERLVAKSEEGEWELYRVPGYLAGMASYVIVGELAVGRVLAGHLPRPRFAERLRECAPRRWSVGGGVRARPC